MAKNVTSTKEEKMFKRDFSKSNKEYFKQNRVPLIVLAIVFIVAIVIMAVFGFKGNFEIAGYTEFNVSIHTDEAVTIANYSKEIENIVNENGGNFDNISIFGKGGNTQLVVRYLNELTSKNQTEISNAIISNLKLLKEDVSNHSKVSPVVRPADYVYAVVAIVLLATISSIFAYFRYNGASALAIILSLLFANLGFLSISALLRLTIGLSYFAMIVALNVLVLYALFAMLEHMRESSWLSNQDYATAIDKALKTSKLRMLFMSIALLVVGLLFVIIAPANIKYVSINIMFIAVMLLATAWYAFPFFWSVFITYSKNKTAKESKVKEK